jgi:hypothetical protein
VASSAAPSTAELEDRQNVQGDRRPARPRLPAAASWGGLHWALGQCALDQAAERRSQLPERIRIA